MIVSLRGEARHAVACQMAAEVVRSFGRLRLQVTGWSMFPSLCPGDILVVRRRTAKELLAGDIILYERNGRLFAHRVIESNGDEVSGVRTSGDAMPVSDPPVAENAVLGKIALVLRNGRYFAPKRSLRSWQRAVALLFRRSEMATRLFVRIHGIVRSVPAPTI